MSFAASLDDLSLPELLQLISFNKKTGKLTLTRRDGHATTIFWRGKILYAVSTAVHGSFGRIFLGRGLISQADLDAALDRQQSLREPRRLGSILVEMGKVSRQDVREAVKEQAERVLADAFQWTNGYFKFEPVGQVDVGASGADDAFLAEGVDTEEVVLEVVTKLDETQHDAPLTLLDDAEAPAPPARRREPEPALGLPPEWEAVGVSRMTSLQAALQQIQSPAFAAEVELAVLRYAAEVVGRGVFFCVEPEAVAALGHFGLDTKVAPPLPARDGFRIPLHEPSVFRDVVLSREAYRGPLERVTWNDYLVDRLGGSRPQEVIAVPIIVSGRVAFILYGDEPADGRRIPATRSLEFLTIEAGLALEKMSLAGRQPRRD